MLCIVPYSAGFLKMFTGLNARSMMPQFHNKESSVSVSVSCVVGYLRALNLTTSVVTCHVYYLQCLVISIRIAGPFGSSRKFFLHVWHVLGFILMLLDVVLMWSIL